MTFPAPTGMAGTALWPCGHTTMLSPVPLQGSVGCSTCGVTPSEQVPAYNLPSPLLPTIMRVMLFPLLPTGSKAKTGAYIAPVPHIPRGHLLELQHWSHALDGMHKQSYMESHLRVPVSRTEEYLGVQGGRMMANCSTALGNCVG